MAQSYRPTPHRRWLVIGVIAAVVVLGLIAYFAFAGGGYGYGGGGGNDGSVGRGYALVGISAEAARAIRRHLKSSSRS
jgi:uncharacterized membrane protein